MVNSRMFLATLLFAAYACSAQTNEVSARVADNLIWVVNPIQDDAEGIREAKEISVCATRLAETAWNKQQLRSFDAELQEYAVEMSQFAFKTDRITVDALESDAFPERSKILNDLLEGFSVFIETCEQKVGGRGVEF